MFKKLLISSILVLSTSTFAQESCESLLSGLEQTLEQTQSIYRESKMKMGFIELASFTSIVQQTPEGLEVSILELTGMQPPENEAQQEEQGWLGPFDTKIFNCKDHKLNALSEQRYTLELTDYDEDSPPQSFTLTFLISEPNHYFLESLQARIKAPNMPLTGNMETSFSDWTLQD